MGRYHQTAADALKELDEQIKLTNDWASIANAKEGDLKDHGLMGALGALKYQAADQCFQELLDRLGALERKVTGLKTDIVDTEAQDYYTKVRESSGAMLDVVQPTMESAAKVIPGGEAVVTGVGEVRGLFSALIRRRRSA